MILADNQLNISADSREHLTCEHCRVARSEAFDVVSNVGQEFRRCRGHVDRALDPEG